MVIAGQKALADMFGVTHKTIVEWQDQGMPIQSRGSFEGGQENKYESSVCIRWYVDRELSKVRTETPADRLNRAKAESVEMDNAERRGLLIPADQLEPKLKAAMITARETLRNEPPRLAREAEGKPAQEIEDMLSEAFDAFLHRLAAWGEALPDDDEDTDDTTAAEPIDG